MTSDPGKPGQADVPFCAIGVDVGGTKIAAGLVRFPAGEVLARRRILTEASRGPDAVRKDVQRLTEELAAQAAALGARVDGIGLGICELVDGEGRVISGNCVDWQRMPVQMQLAGRAPVVVEADVRAAALAE